MADKKWVVPRGMAGSGGRVWTRSGECQSQNANSKVELKSEQKQKQKQRTKMGGVCSIQFNILHRDP